MKEHITLINIYSFLKAEFDSCKIVISKESVDVCDGVVGNYVNIFGTT